MFNIEKNTEKLILTGIEYLNNLSGDRTRHEIEAILREDKPEKALHRANELGILVRIHPALKADKWLSIRFAVARNYFRPSSPSVVHPRRPGRRPAPRSAREPSVQRGPSRDRGRRPHRPGRGGCGGSRGLPLLVPARA